MRRTFVGLAVMLVLAAPSLRAQAAAGHQGEHAPSKSMLDAEMADHFKGIALTADQEKQVMAIKAKHHKAMDMLKKDAKDQNDPELKSALGRHMAAEHADFKALLTPEQYKTFEANMMASHAAEAKKEMKDGKPASKEHDMKGMEHEMKAKPAATEKKKP